MKRKEIIFFYIFNVLKNLHFFGAVSVPFFLKRAGLDYTGMFLLETVFAVSMIVCEIPTGVVADRLGRKVSLFLGAFIFGLAFGLMGLFPRFEVLFFSEILCGFGMTFLSGADHAFFYETVRDLGLGEKADLLAARYDACATIGMVLAFPVGSTIAGSTHWEGNEGLSFVFLMTWAALTGAAFLILFAKEKKRKGRGISPLRQGIDGLLSIFQNRKLRGFAFNFAAISALTFFMFWFYQTILMAGGVALGWQGLVASSFNLSGALFLLLTPQVKQLFNVRQIIFMTSVIPGLLFLGLVFDLGLGYAFVAIFGVTNLRMFRAPMLVTLINGVIEDSNRATVISGVSMIERLITAILYPLVGLLADISPRWAFGVIGLITIVLSLLLRLEEEEL